MAISIDADFIPELPAEQAMNGHTERLSKHIPKRSFDPADGVVNDTSGGTCSGTGKPEFAKQTMNVARILAEKERLEGTQDGSKTRGKKTLTETGDGVVGFDTHESPIEIPFDDSGLDA